MSTDKSGTKGFKRINFFKGFLTTEKDWNEAEKYHVEKRKLHNKLFHAPGVVPGQGGDLKVVSRARGDLSVEVQPGYAIDGTGNDMVLWDATIKNINPEEYRLPQTVYVVLRFYEELTDFIAYKENLEYKGHRRVLESAKVELSQTEPDISREVELARIYLEKGATRVRDARDPADPRANEIDLRFVPKAGTAGARLTPPLRMRMEAVLWQLRKTFTEFSRRGVTSAHDVVNATNSALMLNSSDAVDMKNVFDVFNLIVETEGEMCLDIDVNHPNIAQKKEFTDYKRHVEILRGLIGEKKLNLEAFTNMLAYQTKASEVGLQSVSGEAAKIVAPEAKEEKKAPKEATLQDWEGAKTLSTLNETIELGGITWLLVDQIEILNKESEDKHEFSIKDAKDSYRTRQKLKYPDGTVAEDTGRAHVGGYSEYKVMNLTPGRPVCILRRMDYVYGDYEIEFFVNGKSVLVGACAGIDRVNRWRNWPVLIPAEHVTESSIKVKQVSLTAGRDVNMFHYWMYQPK